MPLRRHPSSRPGRHNPPFARGQPLFRLLAALVMTPALPTSSRENIGLNDLYFTALADLEYLLEPVEGSEESPRPLCLLLGGGGADEAIAKVTMNGLGRKLVERGWAVVVPIAPDGKAFFGRNGNLVPKLVEELQSRWDIADEPVLAVGASNGAIAALEIAAEEPDLFDAVVGVPGIVSGITRVSRLRDLPVFLRVGELDHLRWGEAFPEVVSRLEDAGVNLNAKRLEGERHGIRIDWTELDPWLAEVLGDQLPEASAALAPKLLLIPMAPNRPPRTWTSRKGSSLNASLVQVRDGTAVLRAPSGRLMRIQVTHLSQQDLDYLRNLAKEP